MEEASQSSAQPNPSKSSSPFSSSTTTISSSTASPSMDSSSHLSDLGLSSSSMTWRQSILNTSSTGKGESCNFHALIHKTATASGEPPEIPFRDISRQFLLETGECSRATENFILASSSSSSFFEDQYQSQMIQNQSDISCMQFTNNSNIWNDSDTVMNEVGTGFNCSSGDDVLLKLFDMNPAGYRNLTGMSSEMAEEKKMCSEYVMKKPRMETTSPLPALKVRKEKLGDRISALQQLVSPFGKTDTASVLNEAIEHIKFLHDQVNVLSTPYLKNGTPIQQQLQSSSKTKDGEQDLRSRGLCLVPIASTYIASTDTTAADFWTPTFGGLAYP